MKKKAIIYTEDTTNLEGLAQYLVRDNWEITSAGNAAKVLAENNYPFIMNEALVSETQWSDTFLNTLKTIISTRVDTHNMIINNDNIFLVCINFQMHPNTLIDTKYVALVQAAARNYMNVIVLTDPNDYDDIAVCLMTASITNDHRLYLAGKALNMISVYDACLSNYILSNEQQIDFPEHLVIPYKKMRRLSQGSNPHQAACLYIQEVALNGYNANVLSGTRKIQGKEIGYNLVRNYFIAWDEVSVFLNILKNPFEVSSVDCTGYAYSTLFTPAVNYVFVIGVKHGNIIGASLGKDAEDAFGKAYAYSPQSFTRACLGCSSVIDKDAATALVDKSFYGIIAPDFTKEARKILAQNKELRLIVASNTARGTYEFTSLDGGLLSQSTDRVMFKKWFVVTKRRPNQAQIDALAFGVMLSMKARSDSVVILNDNTIIGFSIAKSTREQALDTAIEDAKQSFKNHITSSNTDAEVLVADTSILITERLAEIVELGVKAILQEGGASDDDALIDFCNKNDISMVFTKMRHLLF